MFNVNLDKVHYLYNNLKPLRLKVPFRPIKSEHLSFTSLLTDHKHEVSFTLISKNCSETQESNQNWVSFLSFSPTVELLARLGYFKPSLLFFTFLFCDFCPLIPTLNKNWSKFICICNIWFNSKKVFKFYLYYSIRVASEELWIKRKKNKGQLGIPKPQFWVSEFILSSFFFLSVLSLLLRLLAAFAVRFCLFLRQLVARIKVVLLLFYIINIYFAQFSSSIHQQQQQKQVCNLTSFIISLHL